MIDTNKLQQVKKAEAMLLHIEVLMQQQDEQSNLLKEHHMNQVRIYKLLPTMMALIIAMLPILMDF